jgi:Ca2+-binding RTX toxin-like protein
VAGNTAAYGSEVFNYGTIAADSHNLFGVDGDASVEGFSPGVTDVVPAAGVQLSDILDPTLADHGGPTLTHALVPGSPALDVIPPAADCPEADQRGVPRPQDDGCDIGAFEFGPPVTCDEQVATLVGTAGDDVLLGTPEADVIHGMGGNDRIDGLEGNDLLCGGDGEDTLRGGEGDDTLLGGRENDRLAGGPGNDTLQGGPGTDVCTGATGPEEVVEGCEAETRPRL